MHFREICLQKLLIVHIDLISANRLFLKKQQDNSWNIIQKIEGKIYN